MAERKSESAVICPILWTTLKVRISKPRLVTPEYTRSIKMVLLK